MAFGGGENKKLYNGYELQNKEFSDGSGLEWYDYKHRFYDDQIGRFFVQDELATEYVYYSPYQFAGNKVPNAIDLDGLEEFYINQQSRLNNKLELDRALKVEQAAKRANPLGIIATSKSQTPSRIETVGSANTSSWVAQQSAEIKAQDQYYKDIQGATMDPVAGQAGMGLAQTMVAVAETPVAAYEHGNSIVQGIKEGDGWKIAGNAALLALDVGFVNPGKIVAKETGALVETASGILKPGGNIIGKAGSNASIRELSGGLEAAQSYWGRLVTTGAKPVLGSSYKGVLMELPNGGTVGLRTMMTRSPGTSATIDVNIPKLFQGKLKFNP